MCREIISVCLALVLCLASTGYGLEVIVGDWEDSLDGWDNASGGWHAESNATLTPGSSGYPPMPTHGTGCLEVSGVPMGDASYLGTRVTGYDTNGDPEYGYNYDPDYPNSWWFLRGDHTTITNDALVKAPGVWGQSVFKIDIQRLAYGRPTTIRGFIHYGGSIVNYAKSDFVYQLPADGSAIDTQTLILDYVEYPTEIWGPEIIIFQPPLKLYDYVDVTTWAPAWFQIILAMDSPGEPDVATLYLDNARFETPEPTTIALLGLGGLILIRRKQ